MVRFDRDAAGMMGMGRAVASSPYQPPPINYMPTTNAHPGLNAASPAPNVTQNRSRLAALAAVVALQFWELDADHDFQLSRADLSRLTHLTPAVLDR